MSSPSPLHSPESVRRFTSLKIGIVLLLILLMAFFGTRTQPEGEPLPPSGDQPRQVTDAVTLPMAQQAGAAQGTDEGDSGQAETGAGLHQPAQDAGPAPADAGGAAMMGPAAPGAPAGEPAPRGGAGQVAQAPDNVFKPATGDAMIELPLPLSFSLSNDPNGGMRLKGEVPDDLTRDHWMNAARLGARGAAVSGDLRLGRIDPASAAQWEGRLTPLVAVVRERGMSELRVRGELIELHGQAASKQEADETLKLIRAQVPDSYRVVSRLGQQEAAPAAGQGVQAARTAQAQPQADAAPEAAAGAAVQTARERTQRAQAQASTGSGPSSRPARAAAAAGPTQTAARQRPANCPASVRSLAGAVYFDSGASRPTGAERRRLRRLGACLPVNTRVRLTGHADSSHTAAYNKTLSERRARTVATEIANGGFPATRISVIAAGQQRATRQARTDKASLRRDRRVDIRVN